MFGGAQTREALGTHQQGLTDSTAGMPLNFTMAPQLIVSWNDKYFLAQRADRKALPILLESQLQPFAFQPHHYRASELLTIGDDHHLSILRQCSWNDGHAPVISVFDALVEQAFYETQRL